MSSRKKFIQNVGLATMGLSFIPQKIISNSLITATSTTKIILLDAVRQVDIEKYMPTTLSIFKNNGGVVYNNLINATNLDSHTNHFKSIFNTENYTVIDINTETLLDTNFAQLVITGFDVAHYNITKYKENIGKADALINKLLINNKSDILIATSMGRNEFKNEMNGLDHHHISAQKCWGIYLPYKKNGNCVANNEKSTIHQVVSNFNS